MLFCSVLFFACFSSPYQKAQQIGTIRAYESFISNDPDSIDISLAESAIFRLVQESPTIYKYEEFIRKHPNRQLVENAWFAIGELYYKEKKYDEMHRAFKKVMESFSNSDYFFDDQEHERKEKAKKMIEEIIDQATKEQEALARQKEELARKREYEEYERKERAKKLVANIIPFQELYETLIKPYSLEKGDFESSQELASRRKAAFNKIDTSSLYALKFTEFYHHDQGQKKIENMWGKNPFKVEYDADKQAWKVRCRLLTFHHTKDTAYTEFRIRQNCKLVEKGYTERWVNNLSVLVSGHNPSLYKSITSKKGYAEIKYQNYLFFEIPMSVSEARTFKPPYLESAIVFKLNESLLSNHLLGVTQAFSKDEYFEFQPGGVDLEKKYTAFADVQSDDDTVVYIKHICGDPLSIIFFNKEKGFYHTEDF